MVYPLTSPLDNCPLIGNSPAPQQLAYSFSDSAYLVIARSIDQEFRNCGNKSLDVDLYIDEGKMCISIESHVELEVDYLDEIVGADLYNTSIVVSDENSDNWRHDFDNNKLELILKL